MPARDASALCLSASHLKMVQAILRRYAPDVEVWAYGSRVIGGGHEASDLDLVARHSDDLNTEYSALFELKDAFVESNLPIRVDILDWSRVSSDFRHEIEKDYVVLQVGAT